MKLADGRLTPQTSSQSLPSASSARLSPSIACRSLSRRISGTCSLKTKFPASFASQRIGREHRLNILLVLTPNDSYQVIHGGDGSRDLPHGNRASGPLVVDQQPERAVVGQLPEALRQPQLNPAVEFVGGSPSVSS